MRYSEAIIKLEKDPTLEFKLVERYKTWTLKTDYDPRFPDDEALYFILECEGEDSFHGAGEFSGNLLFNDDRWEVVRKPVTWQDAIQEFAKGRKLIVTFNNQVWTLEELVQLPNCMNRAITDGIWYLED